MHLLSRYREGIESARRGLAIEPENSYLHHAVARAELMLGRLAEAEAAIVESLRLNPDEPEALALHALILDSRGKRQVAARVAQRAGELAPEIRSVRLARAMTVPLDDEEAIRISRELLAAEPEGAPEHWWHAMNCVRRGRLRDAADHFARASALDPGNKSFARSARVARHWFFWPLRVTSPILFWLAWYSILPLLIFAASDGGVLWKVFWAAATWSLYSLVYLLAQRHANRLSKE
jgi:tetratricopeptide (TPR) repeat protein